MKSYTKEEIKKARKIAFSHLFNTSNMLLGHRFKYDARTRIGKLSAMIFYSEAKKINTRDILALRKERSKRKPTEHSNMLNNKLLIDWRKNKAYSTITKTHIDFVNRNHWAKTSQDYKVLEVLAKYN
jgi:hypothetical protein